MVVRVMSSDNENLGPKLQFSEVVFSLLEFIEFARNSGDEATAREFEMVYERRGDTAYVKLLIPDNPNLKPAIELVHT